MSASEKNTTFATMNNELLNEDEEKNIPKRNSKDDLITKIVTCCEENNVELEFSNTKLRLLAAKIEIAMRNTMAAQVGAPPNSSDKIVALGALRMIHDLCAVSAERGLNVFLPRYGYEVDGFAKSLKEPSVREAVNMCLEEIARETDVLQYVQSPWARLGIAWSGALLTCVRKQNNSQILTDARLNNASNLGPRSLGAKNPMGGRVSGRQAAREELRNK